MGHIVNTNASYLSRKLAEIGIDVYHHITVGDNPARLANSIRTALSRSDIVITTGGLGPTVDDITVETVSALISKKLARIIRNRVGTAPGLVAEEGDKTIVCLPGPPRELEPMFEKDIIPYFRKKLRVRGIGYRGIIKSRFIKITGLPESQVNSKVKDLLNLRPPTTVGIYAKLGEVDLKIMAKAKAEVKAKKAIRKIENIINKRLKNYIFGYDDETLEGAVGKILAKKKKTLAVAESCTGGLVSNRITDVGGSSKYFTMAVVAYSNEAKENILGVPKSLIVKYGAVSKEVALAMAKGVKFLGCVDVALSVTGIAGPTGGTKRKPVGLVYIALVTDKKRLAKELRFNGSRQDIKFQATQAALDMIRKNL